MRTTIETTRIVGGHPALDLANTVSSRHGTPGEDKLTAYADLVLWAGRVGLLSPSEAEAAHAAAARDPRAADRALDRARDLREDVYAVFSAVAAGAPPPEPAFGRLRARAVSARARQRLVPEGGGFRWAWPEPAADAALDAAAERVAAAAAELLVAGPLDRVRECRGRNCGWLFLDATRNRRRRWCSDGDCGTGDRVRRLRARRRAGGRGAGTAEGG
jgi:predicted RNA-binding Zn ribbon-like protein